MVSMTESRTRTTSRGRLPYVTQVKMVFYGDPYGTYYQHSMMARSPGAAVPNQVGLPALELCQCPMEPGTVHLPPAPAPSCQPLLSSSPLPRPRPSSPITGHDSTPSRSQLESTGASPTLALSLFLDLDWVPDSLPFCYSDQHFSYCCYLGTFNLSSTSPATP